MIETRRCASLRLDVRVERQPGRDEVYVRVTRALEEERRFTSITREVVLEHIEICAPRAFFWTAVCLLCDE